MTLPTTPQSIEFFGPYAPSAQELQNIHDALTGWEKDNGILGPSYYPEKHIEEVVFDYLHNKKPIPDNIIKELTHQKLSVLNFHYFLLDQNPLTMSDKHIEESIEFFNTLQHELTVAKDFFSQKFNFSENYIEFLSAVNAKTAPMFFYMAYPDAASHPAQVSLQCVIEASKRNAHQLELLQAATVGWLHDPKLDSVTLSWSNLATHPVIGSAIALNVLQLPEILTPLRKCLEETPDNSICEGELNESTFIQGIVEALSINNDSRFVLENAILQKPPFACIGSEDGIAQQLNFHDAQFLIGIAEARFRAPSKAKFPPLIPEELLKSMKNTSLGTGLPGIKASIFESAAKEVIGSDAIATDVYQRILTGELDDDELRKKILNELDEYKKSVIEARVCGISLFSHHEEVCPSGRQAAYALAVSDPSQLSLHKVIELKQLDTTIDMTHSFTKGFEDNMTYLPKDAFKSARLWQRDMYLSILEAADKLTGNETLKKAQEQLNLKEQNDYDIIYEDIKQLSLWIDETATWQNLFEKKDFAGLQWHNLDHRERYELLIQTLKETYIKALEKNMNRGLG